MSFYLPILKEEGSEMAVMGTVLGFVADIGLDAAKERFKLKQDEFQARAKLMDYLARQQKYNFNCSLKKRLILRGSQNTFVPI